MILPSVPPVWRNRLILCLCFSAVVLLGGVDCNADSSPILSETVYYLRPATVDGLFDDTLRTYNPYIHFTGMLKSDAVWTLKTDVMTSSFFVESATFTGLELTEAFGTRMEAQLYLRRNSAVNLMGNATLDPSPPLQGTPRPFTVPFTMSRSFSVAEDDVIELRLRPQGGPVAFRNFPGSEPARLLITKQEPQWLIEDFESYARGSRVLFGPAHESLWPEDIVSYSGTARVTTDESNDLLDPDIGEPGSRSYAVQWLWKENAGEAAIAVLESRGELINPQPIIDYSFGLSLNILYREGPPLGVALLTYDEPESGEIGSPASVTGAIEIIGAVKDDSEQFVPEYTITAGPDWQYIYFDIPNEPIANFSGGNGKLAGSLGSLAGLAFIRQSTEQVSVSLYLDDIYVGEAQNPIVPPTPTPTPSPTATSTPTPPIDEISIQGDFRAEPVARLGAYGLTFTSGGTLGNRLFVAGATQLVRIDPGYVQVPWTNGSAKGLSFNGEILPESYDIPEFLVHLDRALDEIRPDHPLRLIAISKTGAITIRSATLGFDIGPFGLAVPPVDSDWPAGVYVAEASGDEPGIKRVLSDGTSELIVAATRFPGDPRSIAFGRGEPFGTDLFVTIRGDDDLYSVDSSGRTRRFAFDVIGETVETDFSPLGAMAQTSGDSLGEWLYFSRLDGPNELYRVSAFGRSEFFADFGDLPVRGLAFDESGEYGGYLYVAAGEWVFLIDAGAEVTPTATPTDTPSPTDTPDPEATVTPTPTPSLTGTETPTPSSTPTDLPTSEPDPSITPSNTPTPDENATPTLTPTPTATETPIPFEIPEPIAVFHLDESLEEEGFLVFPGGMDGLYSAGLLVESANVPGSSRFEDASNGTGLLIGTGPGQVMSIIGNPDQYVEGDGILLLTASVQATGSGATIYLIGLDARFDGSMSYSAPKDSESFTDGWHRLTVLIDARGGGVIPMIQVANESSSKSVIVYIDEFKVYAIEKDRAYPGDLFGDAE